MSTKDREHPSVTVDIVTVAKIRGQTKVLLIRRKYSPFAGYWAIPGGFLEPDEPLEAAARRELREETAAQVDSMEQLYTLGDPGRDPRGWTISVAYMAVLTEQEVREWRLRAGSDAREVGWFDLAELPRLAFDHQEILAYAARQLS